MLHRTGRDADYVEVGLDTGVCYNPLHNELDPYAVAYAVATLLNNLFGRSKEPFWQQAYTDLLKFVILLRRISDGYTTFSEIYRYILDDQQIDRDIRRLKADLAEPPDVLVIRQIDFHEHCIQKPWAHWFTEDPDHMAHPYEAGLETFLDAAQRHVRSPEAEWSRVGGTEAPARSRRAMVSARVESTRRTSPIVDRRGRRRIPVLVRRQPRSASRLLSAAKCLHRRPAGRRTEAARSARLPARERKSARAEFSGGDEPWPRPDPGCHAEARFPARDTPAHPQITAHPQRTWRDLLFVCDEYHAFATVGEVDPTGDERTFALSRQARLIPIVATQSISSLRSALPGDESWRTLLQCFRTKLFLATSDEFTARNAAELCGRHDRLKAHYSVSESGRDAHISLLTGRPTSATQSLSASKSYAPHHGTSLRRACSRSSRTRRPSRCPTTASTRSRLGPAT